MKNVNEINKPYSQESKIKHLISKTLIEGGVSFDHDLNEVTFKDGFVVSIRNIIESDMLIDLKNALHKLHSCYQYIDTNENCFFFGTWFNEGIFYLDSNIGVMDKDEAVKIAKANDEIAIWDCKNNCEVKL